MKKFFQLLTLLIGYCLLFQMPLIVKADPYEVKDRHIMLPESMFDKDRAKEEETVVSLVSTDRTLSGLVDQAQYYYTIPIQGAELGSELQLNVKYSELLLPNSTMTISIDDQPIKSVPIDTDENYMEIAIPLQEEMITPGFHEVTVSFYGHITKDICENEENPANWLTILATSSLLLNERETLITEDVLHTYPYPFIQPEKDQATEAMIIIPNDPSANILSSALQVANYFSELANGDHIPIMREKDLKQIESHLVAIGTLDQWDGLIADLFKSTDIATEDGKLVISNYFIQSETIDKQMMFVTGQDDKHIAENIRVLTDDSLVEQLSGNDLVIDKLPAIEISQPKENHPLNELNVPNLKLTGQNKLSQTYFLKLPSYVDVTEDATLHLKFNLSETLIEQKEQSTKHREDVELVIYINDIPHSVGVNQLAKADDKEFYEVKVPIEAQFLNKEQYMSIQFEGHGLQNDEFCVPPNDDDWMYIHEDSFMKFPVAQSNNNNNFNEWPAPFITNDVSETTILLPDTYDDDLMKQLGDLFRDLGSDRTLAGLELVFEKDVTEEQLNNRDVIVLGHMHDHPSLETYKDELMLNIDASDRWDVSHYNFLQETSEYVAWIQQSVWDENKTMAVFSPVTPNTNSFLGKNLSDYLYTNKINSKIIVENINGEIFTYTSEQDKDNDQSILFGEQTEDQNNISTWIVIGFLVVLLVGISLLVILFRRRKKDI